MYAGINAGLCRQPRQQPGAGDQQADDHGDADGHADEVANAVDGHRAAPFLFIAADMAGPETEPEKNTAGQALVLTITHR